MNTLQKTGLVVAGVVGVVGLWAMNKANAFQKVITEMTMNVTNIRNLRTKYGKLFFDCDVTFINNTNVPFEISGGGLIYIRRISLFYNGKLVGNALSNTTTITLPANGSQLISGVQVEIISLNVIALLFNGNFDFSPNNYKLEAEIVALGQTYIIEQ